MTLTAGTKLGSYEILAPLGAGGMGEVYRARDTKLKRDVALKVLPEAFASDPERMARFQREAEVLACLNHPNIAQIYGVEDRALVMELVEGESPKGPMAFEEAWKVASQIAAGLEYAHEKGIVHRDLKPANIKITPDGVVKLLDFGLAKAFSAPTAVSGNPDNSPTLTLGATQLGVILGTAAYMAPEQAKGNTVDKRADIWSFGVILYELLTGEQLFKGQDASETLAQVLTGQPDLKKVPAKSRKLLLRCFERDAKKRLRDIGEAAYVLDDEPVVTPAPSFSRLGRLGWIMVTLAFTALAFVHFREKTPQVQTLEYTIAPPEGSSIDSFALSPDGRYLAMAASDGRSQMWVRALDSVRTQALVGTEDASYPFWSPDSRYIGFFAQGKLKKISVTGGPVQTLCNAPLGRGGTWNTEGTIVFAPTNNGGLSRVSATGGVPTQATKAAIGVGHRFPVFLPDGRHFLYRAVGGEENGVHFASVDGKENRRILPDSVNAEYLPPLRGAKNGYLFFVRETSLMAQAVDPKSMEPQGDVLSVVEPVIRGPYHDFFSVSGAGIVIYQSGVGVPEFQYEWFDRKGKGVGTVGGRVRTRWFALSPDGKRVVIERITNAQATSADLWITDLEHGTESRLTFDASVNENPVWSPDGNHVVFTSSRRGVYNLYEKPSNGGGQDEIVFQSQENAFPVDWSRDGRFIIFQSAHPGAKVSLWALPLTGDKEPIRLQGQGNMLTGRLSPDGRWLAYVSDESARNEVYVIPFFPDESAAGTHVGGKWQISLAGGGQPQWRGDGRELFYISTDRKLMSVEVKAGGSGFEWTAPQALFELPVNVATTGQFAYRYAPAADGKRFLVSTEPGTSTKTPPLTVMVNWTAGLKK